MSKSIYVGNLNYRSSEDDLFDLFGQYGSVESVRIILDRETNRSRGFGFVVMTEDAAAESAIESLDGKDFQGRNLRVNEAIDKRQQ